MSDAFTVLAKLFYLNYDTSVKNGEQGAIINDATTLAYLLDKTKCDLQHYKIISDKYGAVKKDSAGELVFIIEKTDKKFIKDMMKETFDKLRIS
jgi:inosine-uridine nucleoside N-ribohydrolase